MRPLSVLHFAEQFRASTDMFGYPGVPGTFTKFEPGLDAWMHTHMNDVWIVVIKSTYLYQK
jgi:hypothetical protein